MEELGGAHPHVQVGYRQLCRRRRGRTPRLRPRAAVVPAQQQLGSEAPRLPRHLRWPPASRIPERGRSRTRHPDPGLPPNQPYDMHEVIRRIPDDDEFSRSRPSTPPTSSSASAGSTAAASASSPTSPPSSPAALTSTPREKAARFVRTCDAFNIPIITPSTYPASCPAPTRNTTASSAAALSCCTPTARRRSARSPSSPAGLRRRLRRDGFQAHGRRRQLRPGRPPRSRSWCLRRGRLAHATGSGDAAPTARTSMSCGWSCSRSTRTRSSIRTWPPERPLSTP